MPSDYLNEYACEAWPAKWSLASLFPVVNLINLSVLDGTGANEDHGVNKNVQVPNNWPIRVWY